MRSALDSITAFHTGRSAAKALGVSETATGKRYRVGGLLVTFTDTGHPDDSENRDIFTAETDFCINDGQTTIVWYHHGQGKTIRKEKVGYATLNRVEDGIAIDAVLEGPYAETLYRAVERGDLGWSSGTVEHLVDRTPVRCDDGRQCHIITHWPLGIDASLTPIPAYKNVAVAYGAVKSLVDADLLADIELEPTEAQQAAGNYRKGHITVHGLGITIENPKGSVRRGRGPDGDWERVMHAHYGYIKRTEGADGDHVDVFLGEHDTDRVYIVDQIDADGSFDEHKVMLGVRTPEEAIELYQRHYPPGWRVGPITEMAIDEFKVWLAEGDTTAPISFVPHATKSQAIARGYRPRTRTRLTGEFAPDFYAGGTADSPLRDPYRYPTKPDEFGGQRGGGGASSSGYAGSGAGQGEEAAPLTNSEPSIDFSQELLSSDTLKCVAAVVAAANTEKEKAIAEKVRERGGVFNGPAVVRLINLGYDLANYLEVPELGDVGRLEDVLPAGASLDEEEWNKATMKIVAAWWNCMEKIAREIKRKRRRKPRVDDNDEVSSPRSIKSYTVMSNNRKNITDLTETYLAVDAWWAPTHNRVSFQNREDSQWIGNLPVDAARAAGVSTNESDPSVNNGYLGAYFWHRDRFFPLDVDGDGVPESPGPGRNRMTTPSAASPAPPPLLPPQGGQGQNKKSAGDTLTGIRSVYIPVDMIGEVKPWGGCQMIWDSHFGPEPHWAQEVLVARWAGGEREENPYASGDVLPDGWEEMAVDLASPSIEEVMERAHLPRKNAEELLKHLYRCRRGEALAAQRHQRTANAGSRTGATLPATKSLVRVTATRHRYGAVLIDQQTGRFVDNVSVPAGQYLYDTDTRNVYSDLPFLSGSMKKTRQPVVQKIFCDSSDPERACACWDYNKYGVAGPTNPSEIFEEIEHCNGSGIYYVVDGGWRPAIRKESDAALAARQLYLGLGMSPTPGVQAVARLSSQTDSLRSAAKCSCGCESCGGNDPEEQESVPRAHEPLLLGWDDDEWEGKALRTPRGADAGCWATVLAAFYRDSKVDAGDRILEAFATGEVAFPHESLRDYIIRGKTFTGWTGKNKGSEFLPVEFRTGYKNWHSPSASADVLYRILLAYFNCLRTKLTAPPKTPVDPRLASDMPSAKAVIAGSGLVPVDRQSGHTLGVPPGVNPACWVEACQNMLHDIGENNGALGREVIEAYTIGVVPFPRAEWESFARMRSGQADAIDRWLESHTPADYVPPRYRAGTQSWVTGAAHVAFVLFMYYKRCIERTVPTLLGPATGGAPTVHTSTATLSRKSQAVAPSRGRRGGTRLTGDGTPGFYEGGSADNPLRNPYTGGALGDGSGGVPNRDNASGGGYGGGSGAGNDHHTPDPPRKKENTPVAFKPEGCVWPYENYGYPAPVFSEEQLQLLLDGGVTLSEYTGLDGATEQFYTLGVDGEDGGLPDWERLLESGLQRQNDKYPSDKVDPADDNSLDAIKDQCITDWKNYLQCCAEEYQKKKEEPPSPSSDLSGWDADCWQQVLSARKRFNSSRWSQVKPQRLPLGRLYAEWQETRFRDGNHPRALYNPPLTEEQWSSIIGPTSDSEWFSDELVETLKAYFDCYDRAHAADRFKEGGRTQGPQNAPVGNQPPFEERKTVPLEDVQYWDEDCWSESIGGNGVPDWILRTPTSLPWTALYELYRPILGKTRAEQTEYADRTDMFPRIKKLLQAKHQVEDQQLDDMGAVLDHYFSCWWRKHGGAKPEGGVGVPVNGRLIPLPASVAGPQARKSLTFPGARPLRPLN